MSPEEAAPPPEAPAHTTAALFEQAVRQHSVRLLAIARAIVANRSSAEDIVQQALTNLYQHRARYDWREPGGLMRRAVVNEALRHLRQPRMGVVCEQYPDRPQSPILPMIDRETVQRVRQAIGRLPEHFRAALVLCEYEDMDYAQIAQVLGASIPQVKTWLHRGRRQLAAALAEYGPARAMLPKRRQHSPVTAARPARNEEKGH